MPHKRKARMEKKKTKPDLSMLGATRSCPSGVTRSYPSGVTRSCPADDGHTTSADDFPNKHQQADDAPTTSADDFPNKHQQPHQIGTPPTSSHISVTTFQLSQPVELPSSRPSQRELMDDLLNTAMKGLNIDSIVSKLDDFWPTEDILRL